MPLPHNELEKAPEVTHCTQLSISLCDAVSQTPHLFWTQDLLLPRHKVKSLVISQKHGDSSSSLSGLLDHELQAKEISFTFHF